ncbi:protein OPI10 homolog [Anthonomus grandis grandis]|uniref:protein OPI10 homolog n=1 Tax=Anthonomus grandis grandis TaxID=2921223 RepID=UPI0021668843|nr:protein OPI10 homolog [Anthonomus grandis grandis]
MFGIIVSGRPVQTEFHQINERQCVSTIADADNINHIVVFLTGSIPFPEGTAGQVFFSWPDPNAPPNWQLLGYISNEKPSAIYKVSNLKKLDEMGDYSNMMFGQSHIVHNAQIGISIEPISNIQEVPSPEGTEVQVSFAQKMLKSFMDYVLSYTITQTNMVPDPTAIYVPLATVQNWYTNFERRLALHPNFWKS